MGWWRLLGESSAHLLCYELCLQLTEYPSTVALYNGREGKGGCVCVLVEREGGRGGCVCVPMCW